MKKFGIILLLTVSAGLYFLLIVGLIDIAEFVTLETSSIVVALIFVVGPETITEFTAWKLSIKRDVEAAKEIREEILKIRNKLQAITKLAAENSYIIASSSFLAMGGEKKATKRLEKNLDKLTKFAEPGKQKEKLWWKELEGLFDHRKKSK